MQKLNLKEFIKIILLGSSYFGFTAALLIKLEIIISQTSISSQLNNYSKFPMVKSSEIYKILKIRKHKQTDTG